MSLMKFCPQDDRIMTKQTGTGYPVFKCECGYTEQGTSEDTLIREWNFATSASDSKYEIIIDNSPFDLAANVVKEDCPQCGIKYLNRTIIGPDAVTKYVCSCGFRISSVDFIKMKEKK